MLFLVLIMHSYFGFGGDNFHYCYHRYIYYNCAYKKYYNYLCKLNDITTMFVLSEKHIWKIFYTRQGCLGGLENRVKLKSILVWERERERERLVDMPDYNYFLVTILRTNQTLETIFWHIFQNTTKQLKIFSCSKNIFTKFFYIKLNTTYMYSKLVYEVVNKHKKKVT